MRTRTVIFVLAFSYLIPLASAAKKEIHKSVLSGIPEIKVEAVRSLTLAKPLEAGRPSHIYAASGIVEKDNRYYLVSDDESALFSLDSRSEHLQPIVLTDEKLSTNYETRKKQKSDYESILHLTKQDWPPNGALIAWPSASNIQRMNALIVPFDEKGTLINATKVNILPFSYILVGEARELNIEGILHKNDKIYFFQRGNSKKGKSGYFEVPLKDWLSGLRQGQWPKKVKFYPVKLGKLNGVKLTLADGVWTEFGLIGLASAEDTESTFADGHVTGTALVRIVGETAETIGLLDPAMKFEGLLATSTANGLELTLVDDADDPKKPSRLYKTVLDKKLLRSLTR